MAGKVDGRHGAIFYYMPVSLVAWLPWWPLAAWAARPRTRVDHVAWMVKAHRRRGMDRVGGTDHLFAGRFQAADLLASAGAVGRAWSSRGLVVRLPMTRPAFLFLPTVGFGMVVLGVSRALARFIPSETRRKFQCAAHLRFSARDRHHGCLPGSLLGRDGILPARKRGALRHPPRHAGRQRPAAAGHVRSAGQKGTLAATNITTNAPPTAASRRSGSSTRSCWLSQPPPEDHWLVRFRRNAGSPFRPADADRLPPWTDCIFRNHRRLRPSPSFSPMKTWHRWTILVLVPVPFGSRAFRQAAPQTVPFSNARRRAGQRPRQPDRRMVAGTGRSKGRHLPTAW